MIQLRSLHVFKAVSVRKNTLSVISRTAVLLTAILSFSLCSCKSRQVKPAIIWTDRPELASYAELFNASHDDAKAIVIYKEQPARSLPPARDEQVPDIVIGSWLKNSKTRKFFSPLDYLIADHSVDASLFYPSLIEYGVMNDKQYLLPVSFNLPMMVYHSNNESVVPESKEITLDEIKETATAFNVKNKKEAFTTMGYGPSWDGGFLYLVSKLYGADYMEKGTKFICNTDAMDKTVSFIRDWTSESNTDTSTEQNFQFRYLYMAKYKQIATDHCLFAYMPSDEYFSIPHKQAGLSFKWIQEDNKIPIEENIVMLGLYKSAKNIKSAEAFISWITKESTQSALLQRTDRMGLSSFSFGFAGGFSSLKSVNKAVYPKYYIQLLGKFPEEDKIVTPHILPYRWPSLKENVIIPFLTESSNTSSTEESKSLDERISDWTKQYF